LKIPRSKLQGMRLLLRFNPQQFNPPGQKALPKVFKAKKAICGNNQGY